MSLLTKVENTISKHCLLNKEDHVIVGFSGGVDSVVLCDVLLKLGFDVTLVHCNYKLRGEESNGDEQFALRFSKERKIDIVNESFDTAMISKENNESIQIVARKIRYDLFNQVASKYENVKIATGHHKNDDIETVIFNLTNANFFSGASGIPLKRDLIIRPLLFCSKAEIISYADDNNLLYRNDSSNESTKYKRNKIRHKVVPVLEEVNEGLYNTFDLYKEQASMVLNFVLTQFEKWKIGFQKNNYLSYDEVDIDDNTLMIFLWMKENSFSYSDYQDFLKLCQTKMSGKKIQSQTNKKIWFEASGVNFNPITERLSFPKIIKEEFMVNKFSKALCIDNDVLYIDADKVKGDLKLQSWEEGDWFIPIGMKGKKKISDFFIDEKLTIETKINTLLLQDDVNIIWIVGHRIDDRYKVTDKTKKIWKVTLM